MAPASNEDQFKFLISCIRYSDNGKVDFDLVAQECNIVSKGAAAKRYERLMKAHGIHQSQISTVDSIRNTPAPSRTKACATAGAGKKRKLNPFTEASLNTDDDEGLPKFKAEGPGAKVKTERSGTKVKNEPVKTESTNGEVTTSPVKEESGTKDGTLGFSEEKTSVAIPQSDGADDSGLMDDFLAFGASADQCEDSKLDLSGGLVQGSLAGLGVASTFNSGQEVQQSIWIAD